jgi:hypothetical protein
MTGHAEFDAGLRGRRDGIANGSAGVAAHGSAGADMAAAGHAGASVRRGARADAAEHQDLETRLRAYLGDFGGIAGSIHLVHRDDLLLIADANLPEPLRVAVSVIPRGKGMAGTAWLRGSPIQTCDLETDTAEGVIRPGARAVGAGAAVAFPVRGPDGDVVGVVGIAFEASRDISASEIEELAAGAAAVLDGQPALGTVAQ